MSVLCGSAATAESVEQKKTAKNRRMGFGFRVQNSDLVGKDGVAMDTFGVQHAKEETATVQYGASLSNPVGPLGAPQQIFNWMAPSCHKGDVGFRLTVDLF